MQAGVAATELYVDDVFPPADTSVRNISYSGRGSSSSVGDTPVPLPTSWRRLHELWPSDTALPRSGVAADGKVAVEQGALGDCFLLAALGALATRDTQRLRRLFCSSEEVRAKPAMLQLPSRAATASCHHATIPASHCCSPRRAIFFLPSCSHPSQHGRPNDLCLRTRTAPVPAAVHVAVLC